METIDPFYDPAEEERAKQQSAKNALTRDLLRNRKTATTRMSSESENTSEYIKIGDRIPWMPPSGYPPFDNLYRRLSQEVLDFSGWVSLSRSEQQVREGFINRVNSVCKSLWPRCKVVPFGSFLTGLSLPSSDVDISIIRVPVDEEELGQIGCLRKLSKALLDRKEVSFIELRESAKVPILRIKDKDVPSLEIDISLNSEAPQATSKFIIRNGINEYPQFRPLVLLIKCFLYQRNLADTFTGGVGSYLLSCLVLAFLQQHPISSMSRRNDLTCLGHLLLDFFSFYARDLRVDREGLSVRRGGFRFPKSSRRFDKLSLSFNANRRSLSYHEALCVESPLEPSLDIGNKVFQWKFIRWVFSQARQILLDEIKLCDPHNATKSLIASAILDPFHPMFSRWTPPEETTALSQRAEECPPSPYSEEEVEISDSDEEERFSSKRRRHSDEPRSRHDRYQTDDSYRPRPVNHYMQARNDRYQPDNSYGNSRDRFYSRKS